MITMIILIISDNINVHSTTNDIPKGRPRARCALHRRGANPGNLNKHNKQTYNNIMLET